MLLIAVMTDVAVGDAKGLLRVHLQTPQQAAARNIITMVWFVNIYTVLQQSCRHALRMSTTYAARK